jgi:formylglycine-generating enzyme required for sulfatase activity
MGIVSLSSAIFLFALLQWRAPAEQIQSHQAAPAKSVAPNSQVGKTFRDCDGCPEMVVIPSGSFIMGAPATGHKYRLLTEAEWE